jgi:acyl-CoA dehydrogenase
MRAAKALQGGEASREFDDAFTSHIGHVIANGVRAFVHGLTGAIFAPVPAAAAPELKAYYKRAGQLSAAFAFLADMAMVAMGGALKRREKTSARLGDVLSMMYLISATLKRYEDQGRQREDLPLVHYSVRDALWQAQQAIDSLYTNFPVPALRGLLRFVVFPMGTPFRPAKDRHNHRCAKLVLEPGAARDRLTAGMYLSRNEADVTGALEAAFAATVACEPIEKQLREAVKAGRLEPRPGVDTASVARDRGIISGDELALWQRKEALRRHVIKVDDFPQDFGRAEIMQKLAAEKQPAAKAA